MSRSDPIRDKYYRSVEQIEAFGEVLFYAGAALSFAVLLVDESAQPTVHEGLLIAFTLSVIALFLAGLVSRLYLSPRAEVCRRKDFLSSAFDIDLTHERTEGYYNNDLANPTKRMAAQVLENSFFSKSIALQMARYERFKALGYGLLWLLCVLNRRTDLGIVVAASQAVFSEQVIAKWIRLEWLRSRFEMTYDDAYKLLQASPPLAKFNAMMLEVVLRYETAKANAGITLSSKRFRDLNPTLSAEWQIIRRSLGI